MALGLAPGPRIRAILREVNAMAQLRTRREALAFVKKKYGNR